MFNSTLANLVKLLFQQHRNAYRNRNRSPWIPRRERARRFNPVTDEELLGEEQGDEEEDDEELWETEDEVVEEEDGKSHCCIKSPLVTPANSFLPA